MGLRVQKGLYSVHRPFFGWKGPFCGLLRYLPELGGGDKGRLAFIQGPIYVPFIRYKCPFKCIKALLRLFPSSSITRE